MGVRFEELDWRETPIGAISLRRRRDPVLDVDVFEVKLDDEYLMSSLFTVAEVELARLGLAKSSGSELDVVVGGLGLGYTARAALEDRRVRSLLVVEGLGEVIEWHEQGLLPLAPELTGDPRNRFVHGDFFALAASSDGFDGGRRFDAILLDIDHSPQNVLDSGHAGFYAPDGLRAMAAHLRPGGVFALWSDDPPEDGFTRDLAEVFDDVTAHVVSFDNHYTGGTSANTVYVGVST
ncbi:spermidine synthase [Saccharopolyspora endophytica]|uniref:Spermidine synthase n=1 Tax=Saccharopolyspora endophytica TaxID=543886 RepID=A0ABS5DNL4_9PSEU|nr:spermidine synthase [Saccharopolyspora endophytica]MBQ0927890.1 spermidine synthase [Saccharopolyspora endophytica]